MRFFPNEQIDDHGGTTGAVLCGAAAKHRGHRPVRVNSVRGQERRLTGAGLATHTSSVPVSFQNSNCARRSSLPACVHRRRAPAPTGLVAANSPARVERFNAPRRRNFHGLGQLRRQASSDLTPSLFHSTGLLSRTCYVPKRSNRRGQSIGYRGQSERSNRN